LRPTRAQIPRQADKLRRVERPVRHDPYPLQRRSIAALEEGSYIREFVTAVAETAVAVHHQRVGRLPALQIAGLHQLQRAVERLRQGARNEEKDQHQEDDVDQGNRRLRLPASNDPAHQLTPRTETLRPG
jgi:hypothetical protein